MRDLQRRPLLIFFLSTLFSISIAVDTITPTTPLTYGNTLVSAGGSFAIGFFTPSGSTSRYIGIWYNKVSTQTVVWVANRQSPITAGSTGTLTLSANGSLAITGSTWSTPASTTNITNPVAQLLDSGNLVVTGPNGAYAWQSFDYPTDTLLPGLKLGWDRKTGLNRNLTSWASASDPSPGPYNLVMDLGGDPEAYLWSGGQKSWRTGPWSGLEPSGVPELQTYGLFSYEFVDNSSHVYYTYHILNASIVSRLLVNASGQMQRMVWLESSKTWSLYWFAPKDQCDVLATCGPYGVCDANGSPICGCLEGFRPKSPEKWALRDGTDGCVRKTALDCRNGTDGFEKVARAKVPESTMATVDRSMSLDQCRTACLSNCSCKAYASANVSGGGSGCVMWTTEIIDLRVYTFGGQDLFVRLAAADLVSTPNSSHKKSKVAAVVVACCVLGALLIGCAGFCWRKKKTKRRGNLLYIDHNNDESAHETTSMDSELPQFSLVTVFTATNNFSNENKLGEGGFGPVYKGIMEDGQDIAVKRLSKTSLQGVDEFKNEVLLIAKLQHRNLVRLLGCCIDKNERMLVYEYMCNKSLDAFLFDKEKRGMLDWKTRYNIILGIARGLLYLHQDSRLRIVHRDLKASNILLDKDMNPKISDFGMARIFGGDETEVNTRKVVGTYGYMSPEYAMDGVFSVKSDVYSFGVLVLEIISGRRNRGVYHSEDHQNLLGHAWSLWKEGNGHELLDESVARSYSMAEALRCIKVGLLCVQERPEDRPLMSSVVLMLGSDSVFLSPPKQPGFVTTRTHTESDSSTSKQNLLETNEISTSLLEGR